MSQDMFPDTAQTDTTPSRPNPSPSRDERIRQASVDVPVLERADFITYFGENYQNQHTTFLGPTQRGKTTLALQLLSRCISPEHKAVILAGKPLGRDATMEKAAELLNMRRIREWPPDKTLRDRNRNGYVLAPLGKPSQDTEAEDARLKTQFGRALRQLYASRKQTIVVVDETAHVYEYLKLKREYEAPLMRGQPTIGIWSLIQRPRNVTYHAYAAPEHIFMFWDPDVRHRDVYGEIGGVDPMWVEYLVTNLKRETIATGQTVSQALYIRRSGPELMIVDIK